MALKYGDVVVKVQKSRDGSISRVNAIVLGSSVHLQLRADRKAVTGDDGKALPAVEHLDLAFPDPSLVPEGHTLKTRSVESIFRLAYDVAPYQDSQQIGYEVFTDFEDPESDEDEDEAQGSGTERYAEGKHWTEVGDGTDYPPTDKSLPPAEDAAAAGTEDPAQGQ